MSLSILPGTTEVLFTLLFRNQAAFIMVKASNFLHGLQQATAALSFSVVDRYEPDLAELLPWCGNV